MKTKTPLTDAIYPREPAVICTGTVLEELVKLSRRLERENAALRELAARMATEMRETDHEFASLRDYDAARKEAQP